MGIFSFLKGQRLEDDLFARCDFHYAKNELTSAFYGGIIPKELAALLDFFYNNPCRSTALPLIKYDRKFVYFFQDNKNRKGLEKSFGVDTSQPAKTVAMLRDESDFEEYCSAITLEDGMKRHKELKARLQSKGYPEKVISDAFAEYYSEL